MGGAHALGHLWDNGASAAAELDEVLQIRKLAMNNFSAENIRSYEPYSVLEDVFVPLYFFHRYQTEATAKVVGGLDYNYATRGDRQGIWKTVEKQEQLIALDALLRTLDAEELAIPREKLPLFPPRAIGYNRTRESFMGKTGVSFDALSAAETSADMTLGLLLHPERASRLIQQRGLDDDQLGLGEVMDAVVKASISKTQRDSYLQSVQHTINYRVLFHFMNLARHEGVHPQVNAVAYSKIKELRAALLTSKGGPNAVEMVRRIDRFMEEPEEFEVIPVPKIPDGSPIGMDCFTPY